MFLFRKKSLIFFLISGTLWQLIVDLLILKNHLKLTIRKSVNKNWDF